MIKNRFEESALMERKLRGKIEEEKAITLISLIVTIVVLLILASVSIAMLTGENGILTKAKLAKEETENAQIKENTILDGYVNEIDYIGGNRENKSSILYYKMSELDSSTNPYNLEGYISYEVDTGILCLNFYDKSVSAIANASKILDLNSIKELGELKFERNSNESVTNNNDSYFLAGTGMCVSRNMATNFIKNK